MKILGKVCVVTGGASGIGQALARRFVNEGAEAVIIADLNGDAVSAVAIATVMWNRLSQRNKALVIVFIVFGITQILLYQQDRKIDATEAELQGFTVGQ